MAKKVAKKKDAKKAPRGKANQAKPASDVALGAAQLTMGDIVPDQDDDIEQAASRVEKAKKMQAKGKEEEQAAKNDLRDLMIEKELEVYHCRTLPKKVVCKNQRTCKLVKDSPDGEES